MHLIERYGAFVLVPTLFFVVGIVMFVNILWGLLTGGPRAFKESGAPYLYDRFYYLLFLLALVGWAGGLLALAAVSETDMAGSGFLLGWGICAIGMGSVFALRRDMMLRGARYLGENGFWPWRIFHRMQVMQWERMERRSAIMLKLLPFFFIVTGFIVLVVSLMHLPAALNEVAAGSRILVNAIIS